ncbi:unnamed protein product [Camellia sinensis]
MRRAVNFGSSYELRSCFFKASSPIAGTRKCAALVSGLSSVTSPTISSFNECRNIENLVMHSVLSFIGKVDVSPNTYLLHQELLNFMLVAMSTQLLSGPSPGPKDIHPFIDMAMVQESSFVGLVVRKLLLNYIMRPHFALNTASYDMFSEGNQSGVLQRVGSAAEFAPGEICVSLTEGQFQQSIKQILGLQHGKQYDSVKTLRYGHLMIMTDQILCWRHCGIYYHVFSAFGFVHKIATFEKAAGFQALIQFSDAETAAAARDALNGRSIPRYLLPDHVGSCHLRISYSAHIDLNT